MFTCAICHFDWPMDDLAIGGKFGAPICLRCYAYRTETLFQVPRELRRQVEACLMEMAGLKLE